MDMTEHRAGADVCSAAKIAAALILALAPMSPAGAAPVRTAAEAGTAPAAVATSPNRVATCAEGAVNGLITVSIAATLALFAEITLPAYPILLGTGLGVGCSVRIIGEQMKGQALALWQGHGP